MIILVEKFAVEYRIIENYIEIYVMWEYKLF